MKKLLQSNKFKKILCLILFICLIIQIVLIKQFQFITSLDIEIIRIIQKVFSQITTAIPVFISNFGYEQFMFFPLLIVSIFFLKYKKYRELFVLISATECAYLAALFVKISIQRPRPPFFLRLISENGFGFPSGHVIVNTCFYGLIILFAIKYIKNKLLKIFIISTSIIIIALVCISRIWLGVHYPTDILGGLFIGVLLVSLISLGSCLSKHKL